MIRRTKTRLFLILFLLGFTGVASLLLIDISAIVALLPATIDVPTITPSLKLLSLVQPTLILIVAVLIGVALAPRVGLSAPAAEALADGDGGDVFTSLRPQLAPGVLGGLAGGICIVLISLLTKPFLAGPAIDRIGKFSRILPLPTRILYGGITEELLLRWGLMTLIVWAAWRVLQKGQNQPTSAYFVGAILPSSLVLALDIFP